MALNQESMEQTIMSLIMNGGNARSSALKAISKSEDSDFEAAEQLMIEAKDFINQAHEAQTQLIQQEIREKNVEVSLLMVHAQDHVMNAMTVYDLAGHLIHSNRIHHNK